ncbi:MAG: tRNA (adenosine(37)-N6)-threonylcarbamoyltransferase complex dimerization subunit type 1 TsaB [Candidatus Omnitrophica bacterium]|nr:tRNA (adenosine(37)-N6)-threonylcarbamoyltransferase complex dimerization subunit type 1 TsaB [Candidatus Omnitrophota bacterium]
MILVAVETSSPLFSVAAWKDGAVVKELKADGMGQPSVLLTDWIDQVLKAAGCAPEEIDGFAISVGPGSFTGLRVGIMAVKTIAWVLKKPILPVSSLEVIAWNLDPGTETGCVFVDARKKKVYTASFSSDRQGNVSRLTPDRLVSPEEALAGLPDEAVILGDGIRRYRDLFKGNRFRIAAESAWAPAAGRLARIAAARWPQGLLDDPHRLVPQYLYSQESDITGW